MTGEKQDALKTGEVEAIKQLHERYLQIAGQLSGVIVGLDEVIGQLVIGLLCRGHCILEGVPGLANKSCLPNTDEELTLSAHPRAHAMHPRCTALPPRDCNVDLPAPLGQH